MTLRAGLQGWERDEEGQRLPGGEGMVSGCLQGREVVLTGREAVGRVARCNWVFYLLIVADCFTFGRTHLEEGANEKLSLRMGCPVIPF